MHSQLKSSRRKRAYQTSATNNPRGALELKGCALDERELHIYFAYISKRSTSVLKQGNCLLRNFILGKWIYSWKGHSLQTVRYRALYCGTLVLLIAIVSILCTLGWEKLLPEAKKPSQLTFSVAAVVGLYWGLFSSFRNEFITKFTKLTNMIEGLPEETYAMAPIKRHLSRHYMNIAERCIQFKMQEESTFKHHYECVILSLRSYIHENGTNGIELKELLAKWPYIYWDIKDSVTYAELEFSSLKNRLATICKVEEYWDSVNFAENRKSKQKGSSQIIIMQGRRTPHRPKPK